MESREEVDVLLQSQPMNSTAWAQVPINSASQGNTGLFDNPAALALILTLADYFHPQVKSREWRDHWWNHWVRIMFSHSLVCYLWLVQQIRRRRTKLRANSTAIRSFFSNITFFFFEEKFINMYREGVFSWLWLSQRRLPNKLRITSLAAIVVMECLLPVGGYLQGSKKERAEPVIWR